MHTQYNLQPNWSSWTSVNRLWCHQVYSQLTAPFEDKKKEIHRYDYSDNEGTFRTNAYKRFPVLAYSFR